MQRLIATFTGGRIMKALMGGIQMRAKKHFLKSFSLAFDESHDDFLQLRCEPHSNDDFRVPVATPDKIKDQLSVVRYKASASLFASIFLYAYFY